MAQFKKNSTSQMGKPILDDNKLNIFYQIVCHNLIVNQLKIRDLP